MGEIVVFLSTNGRFPHHPSRNRVVLLHRTKNGCSISLVSSTLLFGGLSPGLAVRAFFNLSLRRTHARAGDCVAAGGALKGRRERPRKQCDHADRARFDPPAFDRFAPFGYSLGLFAHREPGRSFSGHRGERVFQADSGFKQAMNVCRSRCSARSAGCLLSLLIFGIRNEDFLCQSARGSARLVCG